MSASSHFHMMQKRLQQIPFTQSRNRNPVPLWQHHLSGITSTNIVEINKITSVTFEKSSIYTSLKIFQFIIVINDRLILLMNIYFPALHFTVDDIRQQNNFTGSPSLNDNILSCSSLPKFNYPIHSSAKMIAVKRFEQIIIRFHFKGITHSFKTVIKINKL